MNDSMASEAFEKEKAKLGKRLYPSLATWEIMLLISTAFFGVGYAIYHVYLASKSNDFKDFCFKFD